MKLNNSSIMNLESLLDKHRSFWLQTDVEEPLVQKIYFKGYKPKPYPLSDGGFTESPQRITPDRIDINRLLGLTGKLPSPTEGLKINWIGPLFPEAWMESLIGCSIYASAFSCTAKPVTSDIEQFMSGFDVEKALKSPWLKVMDHLIKTAVKFSDSQMGVRQLHMRGVIDMLAACLSEESLCLALLDQRDQLNQLIQDFTQLYIEVALRGLAMRPLWNGGHVSSWGLYAPGTLLDYQVDASSMIGTDLYKNYFQETDSEIISHFDYSIVHVHNCGLHISDALIKINNLKAIEISLDREAGIWEPVKIINYCRKIQSSNKSVLIYGQLSKTELDELTKGLDPVGLAVFYWE